jgi:putative ABC transport system permease protein
LIRNSFKTAWRNISRNKIFSFIHVIGLSIGISVSLVIYLVVSYSFSFNSEFRDSDHIYRVVSNSINAGTISYNGGVTYPLSDGMRGYITGLDLVSPVFTWFPEKVSLPGTGKEKTRVFRQQKHIAFVDENYFKLIQYEWLAGSPKTSLSQPHQVVLTESNAKLYFPNKSPETILGRRLYFGDTLGTIVTGIVKDLSFNSDFTLKTFISRSTLEKTTISPVSLTDWGPVIGLSQLFVKLGNGVNPKQIEGRIALLIRQHGVNDNQQEQNQTLYKLQSLSDLHFNHLYGNIFGYDEMAHKPTLYGLLAIAIFLLLLACINFINLTTAQSSERVKEIGIRKTLGSSRRRLIIQFLSETFLLTFLATLLSILLIPFLLKAFSPFIPIGLHFDFSDHPGILVNGVLLLISVSFLAGVYPAMILSSFRPTLVLRNQLSLTNGKSRSASMRKTLTISQFVIAQVFVIGTLLVSKQINFLLHKDLGFKKDAIINFYTSFYDTALQHRLVLLNKLSSIPGISIVSLSGDAPCSNYGWKEVMKYKDDKKEIETEVDMKYADTNYCRLYRIKLVAGNELPFSDTIKDLLINETYAHVLGFQDMRNAVGKNIQWNDKTKRIIGVVADFHQQSLHAPIRPLAITSRLADERLISVALAPQSSGDNPWKTVIDNIHKAWLTVYPEDDFKIKFEDEEIAKSYKSEQDIERLLVLATAFALFISCLGLAGLVIYSTNRRTKEIGIRKIIGGSVTQIIYLLTREHMKLLGWSFVIAVPITWWGTHAWMNNFAYRTNISVWTFISGGLLMGGLAFIILLLKTFKAATANPAESLRVE